MSDEQPLSFPDRDIDVPLEDPDLLPIGEIGLIDDRSWASGITYHRFLLPDGTRSAVGWRDPEVARRKGAEELRKRRQLRAMREGDA